MMESPATQLSQTQQSQPCKAIHSSSLSRSLLNGVEWKGRHKGLVRCCEVCGTAYTFRRHSYRAQNTLRVKSTERENTEKSVNQQNYQEPEKKSQIMETLIHMRVAQMVSLLSL